MTKQELNKACEWVDNMPIKYAGFIERGHCQGVADDFRTATDAVIKESLNPELTWQDIREIVEIADDIAVHEYANRPTGQEDYYTEILKRFKEIKEDEK